MLPFNPAAPVRAVRFSKTEGATPVLDREEARRLFAALDAASGLVEQRDRAILAVMLYDLVRVSAVVRMLVRDFADHGETSWLVLREKGGRQRRLPAHHIVRDYLRGGPHGTRARDAPLFQSAPGASTKLSGRPLDRSSGLSIVKRRARRSISRARSATILFAPPA